MSRKNRAARTAADSTAASAARIVTQTVAAGPASGPAPVSMSAADALGGVKTACWDILTALDGQPVVGPETCRAVLTALAKATKYANHALGTVAAPVVVAAPAPVVVAAPAPVAPPVVKAAPAPTGQLSGLAAFHAARKAAKAAGIVVRKGASLADINAALANKATAPTVVKAPTMLTQDGAAYRPTTVADAIAFLTAAGYTVSK